MAIVRRGLKYYIDDVNTTLGTRDIRTNAGTLPKMPTALTLLCVVADVGTAAAGTARLSCELTGAAVLRPDAANDAILPVGPKVLLWVFVKSMYSIGSVDCVLCTIGAGLL